MDTAKPKITGYIPIFQQKLERNLRAIKEIIEKEGRHGKSRNALKLAIKEARDLRKLIHEIIEDAPNGDKDKTEFYKSENERLKEETKLLRQQIKDLNGKK